MERTFTTRQAAGEYMVQEENAGSVAITHEFGDKFRVYVTTKEYIEKTLPLIWTGFTPEQIRQKERWALRDKARKVGIKVGNALDLRNMIISKSVFNDYEAIIIAAHIMVEDGGYFKSANDLLAFIDNPNDYEDSMKEYSDAVLNYYEYEVTPEAAK